MWIGAGRRAVPGRGPAQGRALPWAPRISDISRWLAQRLATGLDAEVAPGRLMPWLPVAFGTGIVFYFSADREPAWWAPVALVLSSASATIAGAGGRWRFRLRSASRRWRRDLRPRRSSARSGSPIRCCRRPPGTSELAGFVEMREERERSDRIVVRVERIAGRAAREARARAASRCEGHGAAGRQLRRAQGAAHAAARAAAAGRLRLRARHVFPGHRRVRLRARRIKPRRARRRARLVAALRQHDRRHARGDRQAHPRRGAGRRRRDRLGADHRQTRRDLDAGERRDVRVGPRAMCCRSPAITWRWWPASCSSSLRALFALIPGFAARRPIKKWAALAALGRRRRSIFCCRAPRSRPSAPTS